MKYVKSLLLILIIILAVSIVLFVRHDLHQLKYKPIINPHPHYFMTVSGYVNPVLNNKVNLFWVLTYQSYNPKCVKVVNAIEGVTSPRIKYVLVLAKPDKKGHYMQKLPLDYYTAGYCQWKINAVSIKTKKSTKLYNASTLDFFSDKHQIVPADIGKSIWLCKQSNGECEFLHETNVWNGNLSRNKNYKYELDLKLK